MTIDSGPSEDDYWKMRPNAPPVGQVLGEAASIAPGSAREVTFGRGRSAFRMFIVRHPAGFSGYLNICPHYSLPLNHEPDLFIKDGFIECAQHFARFDMSEGHCLSGACEGERLMRVPISVTRQGLLVVA